MQVNVMYIISDDLPCNVLFAKAGQGKTDL
jgi:hypothetical protein